MSHLPEHGIIRSFGNDHSILNHGRHVANIKLRPGSRPGSAMTLQAIAFQDGCGFRGQRCFIDRIGDVAGFDKALRRLATRARDRSKREAWRADIVERFNIKTVARQYGDTLLGAG